MDWASALEGILVSTDIVECIWVINLVFKDTAMISFWSCDFSGFSAYVESARAAPSCHRVLYPSIFHLNIRASVHFGEVLTSCKTTSYTSKKDNRGDFLF
jgi:hypothetical protein